MTCAPNGHGIYARGLPFDYLRRFDFVMLTIARGDSEHVARALLADGKRVYAFADPAEWTPSKWRAAIADHLEWCARTGADGFIADCENEWPGATDAQAEEVGRALAAAAQLGLDVGLTSFPLMPRRAAFARGCDGKVWGSPQVYAKADNSLSMRASWAQDWARLFPSTANSVSLTLSMTNSDPKLATPLGYAAYLDGIPDACGAIGWPTNTPPEWMSDAYLKWRPGVPCVPFSGASGPGSSAPGCLS